MIRTKPSVLMFCPQFRPVVGGAERQAEKLAAALVKAGCRVVLVTPRIDPGSPDIEEIDGVSIERFPLIDLSRRYPVPGVAILNIPYILWQVIRAVRPRLQGVDVLHCHMASLQTVGAAVAGRLARVPVLCKAAMAAHRSDLGEIEKSGVTGRLVACLIRVFIQTWVATTVAVEESLIRAGVEAIRPAKSTNLWFCVEIRQNVGWWASSRVVRGLTDRLVLRDFPSRQTLAQRTMHHWRRVLWSGS